jgi:REP-associated tyrosine transposase
VLVGGVDKRLKEIIHQVAKELGCEILELEVMSDYVHRLCEVDPPSGVHKFARSRLPGLWTQSDFVATVGDAPMAILK